MSERFSIFDYLEPIPVLTARELEDIEQSIRDYAAIYGVSVKALPPKGEPEPETCPY